MLKKSAYVVLILLLIAVAIGKLKSNQNITRSRPFRYDPDKPVGVKAAGIRSGAINSSMSFSGLFEPEKETRVSSDIQGRIVRMTAETGDFVAKGQTIAELDKSLSELQLSAVQVQIEGLVKDVTRYAILSEADAIQGIQLEKSELGLESARIQEMTIKEQIGRASIKAPFSGFVTGRFTEAGAFAAPGVPLVQISDISVLKLTVNVPENETGRFEKGQVCEVTADALPGKRFEGKVIMIGSRVNPGNSFPVQLRIKNTDDYLLKAGMFGRTTIMSATKGKGLLMPASAITGTNIHPEVFRIENGKARLRSINVSDRFENVVVVSSGLSEGDLVVTGGFINLIDGSNVEVK